MNQYSAGGTAGKGTAKSESFLSESSRGGAWTGRGGLVHDKSESFWASPVGGRLNLDFPATLSFGTFRSKIPIHREVSKDGKSESF